MLRVFRTYLPYNAFLLCLLGIVLFIPLWNTHTISKPNLTDGILWQWFYKYMGKKIFFQSWLLIPVLLSLAIYTNYLTVQEKMFSKPNYLTGMSFIFLSAFFLKDFRISSICIIICVILVIIMKLLKLQRHSNIKAELYNIGLLYSLAVLIYSPAIYLALMIGVIMLILRPVYVSEWFLLLLGALTPYYITGSILFLTDHPLSGILPRLQFNNPFVFREIKFTVSLILVILPSLVGFVMIQSNMRKLLVHSREAWSAVFLLLFCGVLMPFFGNPSEKQSILFVILPISFMCAGFFHYLKNKYIPSVMILIWIGWYLWISYW